MKTMTLTKAFAATFAVAVVLLHSCAPAAEETRREIVSLNSETRTPLIENAEKSPVCHVKIDFKYLQPASADDETGTALNQKLQSVAFGKEYASYTPKEALEKSVAQYAENYRKDLKTAYEAAVKEGEDMENTAYMYTYEYELASELNLVRDSIYNYAVTVYEYTGGAHPNTNLYWTNLNARSGKVLKKADVFKSGCDEQLTAAIGKQLVTLLAQRLETDTLTTLQSLYDSHILFEAPLKVPENFLIAPEGIRFLYNRYEIAPYALGDIQVTVPYEEIQECLK